MAGHGRVGNAGDATTGAGVAMPACVARWLLTALDEGARVVVVHGAVWLYRARAWLEREAQR
jgi:hypothetical protein